MNVPRNKPWNESSWERKIRAMKDPEQKVPGTYSPGNESFLERKVSGMNVPIVRWPIGASARKKITKWLGTRPSCLWTMNTTIAS